MLLELFYPSLKSLPEAERTHFYKKVVAGEQPHWLVSTHFFVACLAGLLTLVVSGYVLHALIDSTMTSLLAALLAWLVFFYLKALYFRPIFEQEINQTTSKS